MSHYAKVVEGKVTEVIVAEEDFFDNFIDSSPGEWIQTSYNTRGGVHHNPETNKPDDGTPLRKNFAAIGFTYDSKLDAFYAPKPFSSWTLNETTCQWESPVAYPDDGKIYEWDEDNTEWKEIKE
jgi:hypothetical protein